MQPWDETKKGTLLWTNGLFLVLHLVRLLAFWVGALRIYVTEVPSLTWFLLWRIITSWRRVSIPNVSQNWDVTRILGRGKEENVQSSQTSLDQIAISFDLPHEIILDYDSVLEDLMRQLLKLIHRMTLGLTIIVLAKNWRQQLPSLNHEDLMRILLKLFTLKGGVL